MALSGQMTSSALHGLLRDGKLAGSWVLDASRSEVRLTSRTFWGLAPINGVFRQVSGKGTVSPSGGVAGTITVAAQSIDTKIKKRDEHLRAADFFDVGNHPDITFTVDQITPSGSGVTVVGQLTVRRRTRPASFDAQVSGFDGDEVWLDGKLGVNRTDFGMTFNRMGMASNDNSITVHAVFTRV
jgi:polyisoprenoid-binding protein YceI